MMVSIFPMTILSARRAAIVPRWPIRSRFFSWSAIKLAARSSSIWLLLIARPTIAPSPFSLVFASVLSETLTRRWFVHPRRQHF